MNAENQEEEEELIRQQEEDSEFDPEAFRIVAMNHLNSSGAATPVSFSSKKRESPCSSNAQPLNYYSLCLSPPPENATIGTKSSPLRRTTSASQVPTRSAARSSPHHKKETPNSKRLKRMKEIVQEMTKVIQEDDYEEEEETALKDINNNNNKQVADVDVDDDEYENAIGEAVWVDKNEGSDGFTIHFKCPCGQIYEVLLSGHNIIYYKSMF